jgi:hypothetical protein
MSLHQVQGNGVHRDKPLAEYCQGLGSAPKSEKCTRRSRTRNLQNGGDGKLFDRRPSCCAVALCIMKSISFKNFGSEKFKTAELRRIGFLTSSRILMRHANMANDFQWRRAPIA